MNQIQQLKTAFLQTYGLLLDKMQNDEDIAGKIYRLPISWGNTASGQPLQVILELNLREESFQPLHSIYTYSKSTDTEPLFEIPADEMLSTLSND